MTLSPAYQRVVDITPPRSETWIQVSSARLQRFHLPAGVACPPVYPSRTTGLRSVPMPLIDTSITSPCLIDGDTPSAPIHRISPGESVRYLVSATSTSATPKRQVFT